MHELSIARSVVEICEEHAAGRRVISVVLEIGELSGVVPESIEFCFEACSAGTLVEGARLQLEIINGTASCRRCDQEFPLTTLYTPCPACGTFALEILSGQELRVRELEVM